MRRILYDWLSKKTYTRNDRAKRLHDYLISEKESELLYFFALKSKRFHK